MAKTRIHDDIDNAESSSPAPKRARRSSDEPELEPEPESKQEYDLGQESVNDEGNPSGIEGYSFFPVSYDIPPPSSDRVPSGIEGYYFPDYYDVAYPSSPPSSGPMSPTLMGSSPTVPPEEVERSFERQYHFYDDPGAM